ncbi:MAG: cyclic nucleotide-binding domain-containing protein [candidate division NC10 bacterium]|nr:cyclic nucleotide-binding domain-containing protein [candidate division NC10 bacterium]
MCPESLGERARAEVLATVLDSLCAIPMFDGLKTSELKTIARYMNCLDVGEGDVVFLEGEQGDYVCFVASGSLQVTKTSPDGQPTVLTTLSQGESIGEMAVIEDAPRSANVVALSPARLVTLARPDFESLLAHHPAIGIGILKGIARVLSRNLRKTSGQLAERMLPVV